MAILVADKILQNVLDLKRVRIEASVLMEFDVAYEVCMVGYTRNPQNHEDLYVSYWTHCKWSQFAEWVAERDYLDETDWPA